MKNLYLAIFAVILTFGFAPRPIQAAGLDCIAQPDATQCWCKLDTGEIQTLTDTPTELDCQTSCDDNVGASFQFNFCQDNGDVQLGAEISLANLATYSCDRPENNVCTCQYWSANVLQSIVSPRPNIGTKAACEGACFGDHYSFESFACKITSTVTPTGVIVDDTKPSPPIIPILNVPIPGLDLTGSVSKIGGTVNSTLLGLYIQAAYKFLLIAGSLMAVVMLMVGGLEYVIAGGSSKRIEKAKNRIKNAIIGLVLLFAAFDLAFLLDPRSVMYRPLELRSVQAIYISNETPDTFTENFAPATMSGAVNIPLYDQKQYADYAYGPESCKTTTSGNIKSSGCGVTSFAMVAAGLSGQSVSPIDVAQSFYQEKFRPIGKDGCGHSGTSYDAFTKSSLLAKYGLKSRLLPIGDQAQLLDLIKTNHIIITSYRTDSGGGHFVVISGMDKDGNLIVSNPWGGKRETRSVDWWFARIKSATYVDKAADFIQ